MEILLVVYVVYMLAILSREFLRGNFGVVFVVLPILFIVAVGVGGIGLLTVLVVWTVKWLVYENGHIGTVDHCYVIADDAISIKDGYGKPPRKIQWQSLGGYAELNESLVLFKTKNHPIVVPVDKFSPNGALAVLTKIREHGIEQRELPDWLRATDSLN